MARLEFVGREELEALNDLEKWVAEDPSFRRYEISRRNPTARARMQPPHFVRLQSGRGPTWNVYKGRGACLAEAARAALDSYPKPRKRGRRG